jgi:hypothetical protein
VWHWRFAGKSHLRGNGDQPVPSSRALSPRFAHHPREITLIMRPIDSSWICSIRALN